jgi:hypothetical protein
MKALFGTLANLKIRLAVDDGKLFIDAAPNVVTDEIRAAIRAQKAELISYLTELKSKTRAEQIAPRRADQHNIVPLSFAQQRLWFIDQFEADNAYNLPLIIRLSGNLDALALKQCLDEIVRRHEVLRTTFTMIDDQPVQLVSDAVDIPLVRHDLSTRAPDGREAEALALAQAFVRERFDLSTGPLFKACLVRLGEREHVAVLNMHHIVSDGWSMGVLLNEVVTLYAAYSRQQPSPMSDLAIQYADFALWQRDWVSSKVQDQQLAYWCGQLEGASSILSLPTDHPRPHKQSLQGTTFAMTLSEGLTRALNDLSRQARATLFMTLGAAFNVLLARYSGQDDICIGTPIANRNRAEIEPLIGFFVNTLVLRTRLADVETFDDLLQQVRATTLAAYAHQDIPFELVVDALKPERQLNYNPLFQVMLVLQNAPIGNIELDGLSVQAIEVDEESAKFDLMLTAVERAEQLHLTFTYKVDLFEASTIVRMARHFTRLLESAVQAPNARVGELEMLDDEERQRLLVAFNDTASPYPRGTLAALFETQVRRTPAQVAVVVEDSQLTYAELNARANRVAHYLRSRGVGPDVLVGVCLERSLELVVALLGVLKAGGAYVPLDPAYPMDRLALMLEDCQPHTVLTQTATGPAGGPPRLHHLYLGLDRTSERRDDRARERREFRDLGQGELQQGGTAKDPVLDLDQFRLARVRTVRAAVLRRQRARGQEHRRIRRLAAGRHPDQYGAVGDGRLAGDGRGSAIGAGDQPGGRALEAAAGRGDFRGLAGRGARQPVRTVRDDDVFDLGQDGCGAGLCRAHRQAGREHASLHPQRTGPAGAAGRGRRTVPT